MISLISHRNSKMSSRYSILLCQITVVLTFQKLNLYLENEAKDFLHSQRNFLHWDRGQRYIHNLDQGYMILFCVWRNTFYWHIPFVLRMTEHILLTHSFLITHWPLDMVHVRISFYAWRNTFYQHIPF